MSPGVANRVHCLRPLIEVSGAPYEKVTGARADAARAITDAVVRLMRAHTGKGPTKAQTNLGGTLAIVTLGDCLTKTERMLLSDGSRDLVFERRTALLDGMRGDAVAAVEGITGRRVTAYLTAHDPEPDLATIAFHFDPRAGALGFRYG